MIPVKTQVAEASEDAELAEALDVCLADLEAGRPIDVDLMIAEHPAIAERLRVCLAGLAVVERATDALIEVRQQGDEDDEHGWRLGDFRILREIGRGGMGVVYEAEQISLRRRVALKVLPFTAALDSRQLQRFLLEAQAAACLHHTSIVPVHAVGSDRGVHYYAMQYIEGQSLADVIKDLRVMEGLDRDERRAGLLDDVTTSTLAARLLSGTVAETPADRDATTAYAPPYQAGIPGPVPPYQGGIQGESSPSPVHGGRPGG